MTMAVVGCGSASSRNFGAYAVRRMARELPPDDIRGRSLRVQSRNLISLDAGGNEDLMT